MPRSVAPVNSRPKGPRVLSHRGASRAGSPLVKLPGPHRTSKAARTSASLPHPPLSGCPTTHHSVNVRGKNLAYTATAGTLVLRKDDQKPLASVFFVAYTLDGVTDNTTRPVTFAFNGGPGSSSVWLHLGALGPKRVAMPAEGIQPSPPYHLVDNEDTPLPFTDLVFIDPVTTGFSRHAPGENPAQFHGVEERPQFRSRVHPACTRRATTAGRRPSSSPARATAPPARPGCRSYLLDSTACT